LTANRFFIKQKGIKQQTITLSGEEHHHLSRVSRARPGEKVWLFDFVPSLSLPVALNKLIKESNDAIKLFLTENKGKHLKDILICASEKGYQVEEPPSSVLILVGPEGGWTKKEEDDILNHGFEAVSLGKLILRVETAAICSLSLVSHFWNL
jgi:RsmE family RNA methyltransferase